MTACKDCKFLINKAPRSAAFPVWHELTCTASPYPRAFDPYTGKHSTETGYRFARDVNTGEGDCPKFQRKEKQAKAQQEAQP